jgi:mono/diheme cytochrome c family protein
MNTNPRCRPREAAGRAAFCPDHTGARGIDMAVTRWRLALQATAFCAALPMAAVAADAPQAASQDVITRGAYLARVGDCVACHTAAGGKPYAGGLYVNTPFGQLPTPNLTPDKETGIGTWSDDDFYRAMHLGIRKDGAYLYPGLPYPWFTHVTRDDVLAIKAYLFSLAPVHAPTKPNKLIFPFNIREGIAGWNALYFKPGTFKPDPGKSAEWNRGAYLVEGLGHCADCHTPKNLAQAPIDSEAFAGGKVDDWYAPNITSDPKEGIGTWSQQTIASFLKNGASQGKGVVFGPMAQTVHDSLSHLTDQDLSAMAAYIKTIPPKRNYKLASLQTDGAQPAGEQVYLSYCSSCHQPNGHGIAGVIPNLADNGAVTAQGPQDVIRAIDGGLPAQDTYGPMPGFATILTPQQIADVTNYVRTTWGNKAPATATADMASSIQPKTETIMAGTHWCGQPPPAALDKAIADPANGIQAQMAGITPDNLLPSVDAIVKDVKKVAPQAKQGDIVNSLTNAYCPYVAKNSAVPARQKGPVLDRFSVLVYTQLTKAD